MLAPEYDTVIGARDKYVYMVSSAVVYGACGSVSGVWNIAFIAMQSIYSIVRCSPDCTVLTAPDGICRTVRALARHLLYCTVFAALYGVYRTVPVFHHNARHLPYGTSSCTAATVLYGARRIVRCSPLCTVFTVLFRCSPHCTVHSVLYGTSRIIAYSSLYCTVLAVSTFQVQCSPNCFGVYRTARRVHVSSTVLAELFRCIPYCTVFTAPYELLHGIYRFVRTSPYCTEFTVAYGTHRMARHLSYCTASCMEVYRTVRHSPHSAVFIVLCGIHRIARCSLSRTAFAALHDLPYGVSFDTV